MSHLSVRCILALIATCLVGLDAAERKPPVDAQAVFRSLDKPGDISAKKLPLDDVLALLSVQAGRTISLDPAIAAKGKKPITCRASGQLSRVLTAVATRAGLQWGVNHNGQVMLYPSKELKEGDEAPDWVADPTPVRAVKLGGYQRHLPPPNGWQDPIEALGAGDAEALAKPNAKAGKPFLDAYIDRIEAWHVAHSAPAPELLAWLKTHADFRRELWPALDPRFDDAPKALAIIERLRQKDEKKLNDYKHLAIAIAVVHDTPEAAAASRYFYLWGVEDSQFGATLSWEQIWDYFSDPKRQAGMVFKPRDLVWPVMVHQVDLDLSQDEIDWAWKTYAKETKQLADLYAKVPYDNAKLARRGTALGSRPYVLENLLNCGGVCVDQAHFASRVAKVFGVPSMKCGGEGRYGGAGHAWSGFLTVDPKGRTPILDFTGRYQFDFYYTGTAYDPQTRTEILDRYVALMYEGAAGRYESYRDAGLMVRAALKLETAQPAVALNLVREAMKQNPFVADGWRLLMRLAGTPVLSPKEADTLFHSMLKFLVRHPDLSQECLAIYLEALPTDKLEPRLKLYQETYQALGVAKRPDLQIQVRLDQLEELAAAGRNKEVITLAFEAVGPNAKEGTLVMPLVKQVVALAKQFATSDPKFRLDLVKDGLAKFSADFPKARGNEMSPAWVEYQELMAELR